MPFDKSPIEPLVRELEEAAALPPTSAEQWVRLTAAIDALRSLLEDSYVKWPAGLATKVRTVLETAADDPHALIDLVIYIANLKPLEFETELGSATVNGRTAPYTVRVAAENNPGFLISTGQVRSLPVLDDTLTDPDHAAGLVEAYAAAVKIAEARYGVKYLAFIDKNFGPIGALGLIAAVVSATKLPATVYRERKWSKKADFSGYRPEEGEKGVIIYDLVNTGSAIRNAANRISERFRADVAAAVVLYDLSHGTEYIDVQPGKKVIVLAMDGVTGPSPSLTYPVNPSEREIASVGGAYDSRSFPNGEEMPVETTPQWRSDLSSYPTSQITALSFRSRGMMRRAISALWNDPAFAGAPVEMPRSSVLFVPKDAVPLLRIRGLKFDEQPIVDPSQFPRSNAGEQGLQLAL